MNKQLNSSACLAQWILCVCVCILVIFSALNGIGFSTHEAYVYDLESHNSYDQSESDNESLAASRIGHAVVYLLALQISWKVLNFRSVDLSPVIPPPKYS
jgi:hypothetical protein